MTNVGKWDRWYELATESRPYGDPLTYKVAAEFLAPCQVVEDWGCGFGWFRQYASGEYLGVDGSDSQFTDVVADLTEYQSQAEGILIRHVLEHDWNWVKILDNAVASFTQRLCLIIFTPFSETTHELVFAPDPGVPDISFRKSDITDRLPKKWTEQSYVTDSQYRQETVFCVESGV